MGHSVLDLLVGPGDDVLAKHALDALTRGEPWEGELHEYETSGHDLADLGKRIRDSGLFVPSVIGLWDAAAGQELMTIDRPGHLTPVTCVAQHPGAGLVASADKDPVILLWDRDRGHLRKVLFGHAGTVSALAFQPDGRRLASAAEDGTVAL